MASREARRIKERLTQKKDGPGGEKKKISALTIPAIIIIGLVLIGLLWWGNSDSAGLNTQVVFGQYNGTPIVWSPSNYFGRKVAEATRVNNTMEVAQAIRMLIPYMTFHIAALQEAERSGISVSDPEVEDYIVATGARDTYNKVDATERHALFDYFREELIEIKVLQSMYQTVESKTLVDFGAAMGADEKKFRLVQWLYDEYPVQEVIAYATENPGQFKRIKLSRLTAATEEDAQAAYDKISSKQSTFDEQLSILSATQSEGTASLDWKLFYLFSEEIGDPEAAARVFALNQGEISEVLNAGGQWVIYRCDEAATDPDLSDKKTVDEIRSYIITYQKGRVETFYEIQAGEFLSEARKTTLDQAAAQKDLQILESDFFPINRDGLSFLKTIPPLLQSSGSLSDAQYDSTFFKQAFSLAKGSLSEPILLSGKVIVLELADEQEISTEDLNTIKSSFREFNVTYFGDFLAQMVLKLYIKGLPYDTQSYQPIPPYSFYQAITSNDPEIQQQFQFALQYGLIQYINPSAVFPQGSRQNWPQFYLAFIDEEKAGSEIEQEEMIQKGFEALNALNSAP